MIELDKEEREILEAFEKGELKPSLNRDAEMKRLREIAAATLKKDARINIRISSADLHALQSKAMRAGIPYQTFISSILHKYADGQLIEKS